MIWFFSILIIAILVTDVIAYSLMLHDKQKTDVRLGEIAERLAEVEQSLAEIELAEEINSIFDDQR